MLFHVDAAQTFGKEVDALRRLNLISCRSAATRSMARPGVGALYVRRRGSRRMPLKPLMVGGGQEMGLRPGTLPVPLIVGLGNSSRTRRRRSTSSETFKRRDIEATSS